MKKYSDEHLQEVDRKGDFNLIFMRDWNKYLQEQINSLKGQVMLLEQKVIDNPQNKV